MQHSLGKIELSTAIRLLEASQQMAKIGSWEYEPCSGKLILTDEAYRIFETSPQESKLTLNNIIDYFLPESKKNIRAALNAAINDGIEYDLTLEMYTTLGRKIDVRASCNVVIDNGKAAKITGVFHDVTDSVNQQREIEQNHQRLQIATDSAELGVWEYNLLKQSLIWDKRMYRLYGVDEAQFTGAYDFWKNALLPQDMEQATIALNESIKNKKPFKTEFRVPHPDASLHWISASGYPILDKSGQVIKVIGTNQNIDSIKAYQERIETSQKFANTGSWEWHFKTGEVYWSATIVKMYGMVEENTITNHEYFVSCLHPDDQQFVQDSVNACIENGEEYNIQHRIVWPDGSIRWIAAQGNVIRNQHGEAERMLGMAQDITSRKEIEDELVSKSLIVTNMEEGASLIRVSDQTIISTNPAFDTMFGYEVAEANGLHVSKLHAPSDISPQVTVESLERELEHKGIWRGEVRTIKKDGTIFWCSLTTSAFDHPVYDKVWVFVISDITAQKLMLEKLSYQASHDQLTGLISRYEFEKRTTKLLSTLNTSENEHAICFLDLDQFKIINDTCGHAAGDELLRQLGRALVKILRKRDILARLGGDEFGILMENCTLEEANRTGNKILDTVRLHQFFWEGKIFRIGVSIGLVAFTDNSNSFSDLLRQADAACYVAKDLGRNRIHTYRPDDSELANRHGEIQWVGRINNALEEDHFCLYAQEIVSLDGNANKHYEVLVRMIEESDAIITPNLFLPAAERYNLIQKIDAWVITHSFNFLAKHPAFTEQIEFISINLSGQSLSNRNFLKEIIRIFKDTGISPRKICFEVTETDAVSNMSAAITFIKRLKSIGCQFALDDFGSGISSFGYLKRLPVDYLKIDGLFVKDMATDPIDHAMVKSINEVGQVMGMKTIAEFVENDDIKMKLKAIGVNFGQGYGLGKPQPLENLLT